MSAESAFGLAIERLQDPQREAVKAVMEAAKKVPHADMACVLFQAWSDLMEAGQKSPDDSLEEELHERAAEQVENWLVATQATTLTGAVLKLHLLDKTAKGFMVELDGDDHLSRLYKSARSDLDSLLIAS